MATETEARTQMWQSLRNLLDALTELVKEGTEALREERGRE